MKLVNKLITVVVFSSLLSLSAVQAATTPESASAAPPAAASLETPPQAAVKRASGQKGGGVVSTKADGVQLTTGWYKVQQIYRFLGDSTTWAYLEGANQWIWCNDNECEQTLIAAAESYHWLYLSMTSASTFNAVRLYKN